MTDDSYSLAIGKLIRIKYYLKPSHHEAIDDIVEALVSESEGNA